ncbi:MAG: hypothetical protein ISS49_09660 [Anaerolineae bacterium]|nr:hypothetical protein [Anaerolineae bacterium]
MLQAITFDFWGTLYQNAYARDERLHLLEDILVRHSQPRPGWLSKRPTATPLPVAKSN